MILQHTGTNLALCPRHHPSSGNTSTPIPFTISYFYDHLNSDRVKGGTATLVKGCIFSAPVNIQTQLQATAIKFHLPVLSFTVCNILFPTGSSCGSRDSNWLWAGRQRCRSSSSGRVKNSLFSTSSRPALGPTQSPIQWVPGALSQW
jgi:hypothetical protein